MQCVCGWAPSTCTNDSVICLGTRKGDYGHLWNTIAIVGQQGEPALLVVVLVFQAQWRLTKNHLVICLSITFLTWTMPCPWWPRRLLVAMLMGHLAGHNPDPVLSIRPTQKRGRGRPKRSNEFGQSSQHGPATRAMASPATGGVLHPFVEPAPTSPLLKQPRREALLRTCVPEAASSHGPGSLDALQHVSAMGQALLTAQTLSNTTDEFVDDDVVKVVEAMLLRTDARVQSGSAEADVLGVGFDKMASTKRRAAAAFVALSRAPRAALEQAFVDGTPGRDRLLYFDWAAHDETPLNVSMRTKAIVEARAALANRAAAPTDTDAIVPFQGGGGELARTVGDARHFNLSTAGITQKLAQTINKGALVVRRNDKLVTLVTAPVCPLSVVEANTAACAMEAQLQVSSATALRERLLVRARGATTDRGAENKPCERAIADMLYHGQAGLLHTFCEVHMTAGIHKKVFAQPGLDPVVSGAIRTALSLRNGAAMLRFRKALREEVQSRLQVCRGVPAPEARRYRQAAITMFMQRGPHISKRRLLMAMVPNGEWRSKRVQYYIDPTGAGPQREEDVPSHLVAGLLAALADCAPPVYARHRWTGADIATDALGILEVCHKLGSTTYMRFAASYASGALKSSLLLAGKRLAAYTPEVLPSIADVDLGAEGQEDPAHVAEGRDGASNPAAGTEWAKVNAEDRKLGVRFWMNDPLGDLCRQRLLLEPLRADLEVQFAIASERLRNASTMPHSTSFGARREWHRVKGLPHFCCC